MMDVEILGQLVLRIEDRPAQLGPMLRALVAALVCADGHTLTSASLERRLWETPPASRGGHPAQSCRPRPGRDAARGRVGRPAPRSAAPGDREGADWGELPASAKSGPGRRGRFARHIRAGQAALRFDQFEQANGHFREALTLWRGRPLADVAHLPFARAHIANLTNLRMTAWLGRIEADIWSGHYRELIGEFEVLFAARPDDGAVPRLLATSLYLSERLAEAALVCQQAIVRLQAHGLGAGPMADQGGNAARPVD